MKICDKCKSNLGVNSYKINSGMYYLDDDKVKYAPQIEYCFDFCSKCWGRFRETDFYRIVLDYIKKD